MLIVAFVRFLHSCNSGSNSMYKRDEESVQEQFSSMSYPGTIFMSYTRIAAVTKQCKTIVLSSRSVFAEVLAGRATGKIEEVQKRATKLVHDCNR